MTLLEELGKTIAMLEAGIPASPNSPKSLKAAERLEKVLQGHFKDLKNALSLDALQILYNKYVDQE
ncbi:hypothetical protein LCGC14_2192110 [marine sediment metagenome]|uniref:Uncharacterized protein n=1 Tax=marine sediment metagenome TaxID=412755 RepID=A0A0F9FWQ2_9ZZZZ